MKKYFKWLSSLYITIFCLAGVMVLVFFGTIEQVSTGIYVAQEKYFRTFFVYWQPDGSPLQIPYFPGGYFFASLFLLNLAAASIFRFRISRQKVGILSIHLGVAILIIGEFVCGIFSRESQMAIRVGDIVNYSVNQREMELVVVDLSHPEYDQVVSFSETMLQPGRVIEHQDLPFSLHLKITLLNSSLSLNEGKASGTFDR